MELSKIIKKAVKGDPRAQRYLYDEYRVMLFTVCLRYARDRSEAEDILQEGFIKIFRDLRQLKDHRTLAGWMRRVMVNTALQYLRKWRREFQHADSDNWKSMAETGETVLDKLGAQELIELLKKLPDGYRTVFNLYVIDGYSHAEIAEQLGISVSTSKTQLFKAKAALRALLEKVLLN